MNPLSRAILASSILELGFAALPALAGDPGVTFVGRGLVAGSALDRSRLAGSICSFDDPSQCIPRATFGGFGSALAYTGHHGVFLAASDRGPFDGRTDIPYEDRVHLLRLRLDPAAKAIQATLVDTVLLRNRFGENLVGSSSAFVPGDDLATLRFDPEGIAVGANGTFFVSDEYGPYVFEFDRRGRQVRRIPVPAKFRIANPSGEIDASGNSLELYPDHNTAGRQANRGMEGLALTPDGRTLVGIMQNALIQDEGLNTATPPGRLGRNNRIYTFDLRTGKRHEYVYPVDAINQGRGVNEILAINDHEFLVLERDNRSKVPTPPGAAQTPNLKRIYRIDLAKPGLTDVSGVASLPETPEELAALPTPIVPVTKTLFLDLLDPSYAVSDTQTIKDVVAEKIEGLAWGPALPDGRPVLYVISDNDLYPGLPTQIYAFAVDPRAAGVRFEAPRSHRTHAFDHDDCEDGLDRDR